MLAVSTESTWTPITGKEVDVSPWASFHSNGSCCNGTENVMINHKLSVDNHIINLIKYCNPLAVLFSYFAYHPPSTRDLLYGCTLYCYRGGKPWALVQMTPTTQEKTAARIKLNVYRWPFPANGGENYSLQQHGVHSSLMCQWLRSCWQRYLVSVQGEKINKRNVETK